MAFGAQSFQTNPTVTALSGRRRMFGLNLDRIVTSTLFVVAEFVNRNVVFSAVRHFACIETCLDEPVETPLPLFFAKPSMAAVRNEVRNTLVSPFEFRFTHVVKATCRDGRSPGYLVAVFEESTAQVPLQ